MAVIRVVGTADGARIIQGVIPNSFIPPKLRVTTEYRLYPDTDTIEILSWLEAGEYRWQLPAYGLCLLWRPKPRL